MNLVTRWQMRTEKAIIQLFLLNSQKFQSMPRQPEHQIRRRIQSSGQINQIEELCLDGIEIRTFTPNIRRLIEGCSHLQYLTMNNCELQSLDNFPQLRNLIGLELSDNQLTAEDIIKITNCKQINFITLDNNLISSLTSLKNLSALVELQILQVHDNPIANEAQYRQTIFQMIPSLNSIDCIDRYGQRVRQEDGSDYITIRERSQTDLNALLFGDYDQENDEFVQQARRYSQMHVLEKDQMDAPETRTCLHSNLKRNHTQSTTHRSPNGRLNQFNDSDSDSDEDGEMIRDFKKKMQKGQ